jgi:hypothetical protein
MVGGRGQVEPLGDFKVTNSQITDFFWKNPTKFKVTIFLGGKKKKLSRIRKQVPTCANTLARNPNSFQIRLRLLSPTHLVHKTAKKKP